MKLVQVAEENKRYYTKEFIHGFNTGAKTQYEADKKEAERTARWLPLEGDGYADGAIVYDVWECSNCGNEERGEDVPETNRYCRWCGARMEVE